MFKESPTSLQNMVNILTIDGVIWCKQDKTRQAYVPLLEFFSVRQIWHFSQFCVKYVLLIIVQIEKC